MSEKCSYAHAGTYGHECGKPPLFTGIQSSANTVNGVFYAARCAECKELTGRDNWAIREWLPFDPIAHVNRWKSQA